jgi:hypothetical protein
LILLSLQLKEKQGYMNQAETRIPPAHLSFRRTIPFAILAASEYPYCSTYLRKKKKAAAKAGDL